MIAYNTRTARSRKAQLAALFTILVVTVLASGLPIGARAETWDPGNGGWYSTDVQGGTRYNSVGAAYAKWGAGTEYRTSQSAWSSNPSPIFYSSIMIETTGRAPGAYASDYFIKYLKITVYATDPNGNRIDNQYITLGLDSIQDSPADGGTNQQVLDFIFGYLMRLIPWIAGQDGVPLPPPITFSLPSSWSGWGQDTSGKWAEWTYFRPPVYWNLKSCKALLFYYYLQCGSTPGTYHIYIHYQGYVCHFFSPPRYGRYVVHDATIDVTDVIHYNYSG